MNPLLDPLERHAADHGEKLAAGDQSLMLDYRGFAAVAAGLGRQIGEQSAAQHVGILAPTSTAGAAAIFACWSAGRTPVPLNFLLAPDELARVIRDAGLELIVTIDRFAPAVAATGLKLLILNAQTLVPGRSAPPAVRGDDLAVILYTSGTAAEPKGVCLSFDNIVQNATACVEHARIHPDQVFLSILPQFHSFGFTAMTIVPLLLGATVHFLPRFSPLAVIQTIAEKRATIFMAVASMYAALAHVKSADRDALASLRLAVSGGEPLPGPTAAVFEERFGVPISEGYGLTETSPVVSINTPWQRRPGSVGRPLPGVQVVAADDGGRELAAGQEGELLIRGHCVMRGYWKKPEATAAAVRDGALHTGDLGRVDAEGFVYITGRSKDMLIVGGENVYPREIENVLLEHPAVAEAAVIGQPDALRGETVLAYVILKEGAAASELELREFCRPRLAGYKAPREVRIAADLPRSPTGKILKRALREQR